MNKPSACSAPEGHVLHARAAGLQEILAPSESSYTGDSAYAFLASAWALQTSFRWLNAVIGNTRIEFPSITFRIDVSRSWATSLFDTFPVSIAELIRRVGKRKGASSKIFLSCIFPGASKKMTGGRGASVPKLLYRALLRWAKDHKDVPISIRTVDVYKVLPEIGGGAISLRGSTAVHDMCRWAFRQNRNLTGAAANYACDRGMEALRLLNSEYAALAHSMRITRASRTDRQGVDYKIGQVIVHRWYGYRGVIYGWDRHCERDEDWIAQMRTDPSLPHYYVLPDEHDCHRLFGGERLTKYVCQFNILPVKDVTVVHRALGSYFVGYSNQLQRYVPVSKLQYEYPDVYTVDKSASTHSSSRNARLKLRKDDKGEDDGEQSISSSSSEQMHGRF